jgi:hypothetical protein
VEWKLLRFLRILLQSGSKALKRRICALKQRLDTAVGVKHDITLFTVLKRNRVSVSILLVSKKLCFENAL